METNTHHYASLWFVNFAYGKQLPTTHTRLGCHTTAGQV